MLIWSPVKVTARLTLYSIDTHFDNSEADNL